MNRHYHYTLTLSELGYRWSRETSVHLHVRVTKPFESLFSVYQKKYNTLLSR